MIELVDTHCHIHSINELSGEQQTVKLWSKLGVDTQAIISRASQASVTKLITVGCSLEDSRLAINAASKNDHVWATIGIHPHEAKHYLANKKLLADFAALSTKDKVVAVGECGLDYYYTHSEPKTQKTILEFQLDLAAKQQLPVIFHVREAFDDFWPIFDNFKIKNAVLHSFTDNLDNLNQAVKRGLYVGVNGIATFTKDQSQTEVYRQIPIENLVLETDAPYLTPAPIRGNVNEPKNVRLVAEYLASLRGTTLETIASQTTQNARQLFNV